MQVHGMSEDGQTITLHRFSGGVECSKQQMGDELKTLVVVDVETTGLDPQNDRMIEFAAAQMLYAQDGRIVQHVRSADWLEDPGIPIPQIVQDLTGITDEMVKGCRIPDEAADMIADADMLVSHNAAFDWPFCRRRWPDDVDGKIWACSLSQIDWAGLGFPAARQEILARYHGFFYDAHRAQVDVEALVKLLQLAPGPDRPTYLQQLLSYLDRPRYRIRALGTPFSAKDDLKGRSYRWDPERRVWWTTCSEDDLDAEKLWLDELYAQHGARGRPSIKPIEWSEQWA